MIFRHALVMIVLGFGIGSYHACAQNWTAGSSPVINSGSTVTVSAAEPDIVQFTDNGTLTFTTGGSVTLTGPGMTAVGSGNGASGVLTMSSGSSITHQGTNYFVVGYLGGTGSVNIASGATLTVSQSQFRLGGNEEGQRDLPSHGEATISGTLSASMVSFTGYFPLSLPSPFVESAKLTLNEGGVAEIGQLNKNDDAQSTFLFNGGTLRALWSNGDFVNGRGLLSLVVADGKSAIFDTNGKDITINPLPSPYNAVLTLRGDNAPGALGNGGLIKTGTGTLTFNLAATENTFTGAIEVVQGTLDLGRALAANQTVTVHAGATFVMYSPADASKVTVLNSPTDRMLYAVGADTDSLNLTALSSSFYDDRLGTRLSGSATLSGELTHSTSVGTVGAPFRLLGQGGTLNLTNTTLETKAVQVEGPGTFNFMGNRTFTSADTGKLVITDGGYRQDQVFALADASASTPSSLSLATGRVQCRQLVRRGRGRLRHIRGQTVQPSRVTEHASAARHRLYGRVHAVDRYGYAQLRVVCRLRRLAPAR